MPLNNPPISASDYQQVESLLGRPPRGLAGIAVRDQNNNPVVIQVATLVDQKPFPTLFWLVDKHLNYAIDQLEAGGLIADFQQRIDQSDELQARMADDHKAYIKQRWSLTCKTLVADIAKLGFTDLLQRRGIGGIENFSRIRCLHTYYAAHLVTPNTVGQLLDEYWSARATHFPHLVKASTL